MSTMNPKSGNENILEGKWKQLKGSVREKWGKLTNDDLDVIAGRREQLVGKLQEHYGREKKDIEKEVDEFIERSRNDV